jgi:hypothetical protein
MLLKASCAICGRNSPCSNDHDAIYDELEQAYLFYEYSLNLFEDCFEEEPPLAEHAKKSAEKSRRRQRKRNSELALSLTTGSIKCAELEQKKTC